eukprot:4510510-Amphidinium_carterae.2
MLKSTKYPCLVTDLNNAEVVGVLQRAVSVSVVQPAASADVPFLSRWSAASHYLGFGRDNRLSDLGGRTGSGSR